MYCICRHSPSFYAGSLSSWCPALYWTYKTQRSSETTLLRGGAGTRRQTPSGHLLRRRGAVDNNWRPSDSLMEICKMTRLAWVIRPGTDMLQRRGQTQWMYGNSVSVADDRFSSLCWFQYAPFIDVELAQVIWFSHLYQYATLPRSLGLNIILFSDSRWNNIRSVVERVRFFLHCIKFHHPYPLTWARMRPYEERISRIPRHRHAFKFRDWHTHMHICMLNILPKAEVYISLKESPICYNPPAYLFPKHSKLGRCSWCSEYEKTVS